MLRMSLGHYTSFHWSLFVFFYRHQALDLSWTSITLDYPPSCPTFPCSPLLLASSRNSYSWCYLPVASFIRFSPFGSDEMFDMRVLMSAWDVCVPRGTAGLWCGFHFLSPRRSCDTWDMLVGLSIVNAIHDGFSESILLVVLGIRSPPLEIEVRLL